MKKNKTQVLIVGGGPCGLMAALLLGKSGIETIVLEKHPGISSHPKAMGVTRRTAEIYRQVGLLEKMLVGGLRHPCEAVSTWSRGGLSGELLGSAPMLKDDLRFSPCSHFHCAQPHNEAVLLEAAQAQPTVDIRFQTRALEFSQDTEGVSVVYENPDRSTETIRADYLIAADGDRSPIREKLGIHRHGPGDMGRFLSVYFRADYREHLAGRHALIANTLGEDFFEVFVTVNGDDLWLMHHFLEEGETPEDWPLERLHAQVIKASGMPDTPVQILSVSPWVMSPSLAPEWRCGRIFLVGDAAARVSPSGGLGLNNGIQGVHNLAWKLAAVLRGEENDSLLETYQAERLAASKFTFENSGNNAGEIFEIVTAAFSGDWEKTRAHIASSRRAGAGFGQDFGIVYQSADITPDGTQPAVPADLVNDYIPQARPGHRAPHLWVERDGKRASLLDFFGGGFTLLCGLESDPSSFPHPARHARIVREGLDFQDPESQWLSLYGISRGGFVMVRPDGYVSARVP
jgi:putative polyketide hydroxylase